MKLHNQQLWNARYQRSRKALQIMIEDNMPEMMIQSEARLLLTASYGGPWKLIAALIRHRLNKMIGG